MADAVTSRTSLRPRERTVDSLEHATRAPAARPQAGPRIARPGATTSASLGLLVAVIALAVVIVVSQKQTKSRVLGNFEMRGASSAIFVSAFLGQQAGREEQAAERFLAAKDVAPGSFRTVVGAFGSPAAVLLDAAGRVLDVAPAERSLPGQRVVPRYAHLTAAEHGEVAISSVVPLAATRIPVTAVAVPFATREGRRVLSVAYPTSESTLEAFANHTVPYSEHEVFLVDKADHLIAASPRTGAATLAQADPALARAVERSRGGAVTGSRIPTTFTVAPVANTSWRLIIAVPNDRLFASIGGWSRLLPWLVFALVAVLGAMLVALFSRSHSDRTRLAILSADAARTARTDALTGLYNRRALGEQLTRALAHARRHSRPVSILMIDLDRFKETNDRFGHEAGDEVLRAVADSMREVLRAEDLYGRWGGDEFLVVLPDTDLPGARAAAERIRASAGAVDLKDIGLARGVPMSIGAAVGIHTGMGDLLREADLALYAEKAGRAADARRAAYAT